MDYFNPQDGSDFFCKLVKRKWEFIRQISDDDIESDKSIVFHFTYYVKLFTCLFNC
jgi:hypothetical protein